MPATAIASLSKHHYNYRNTTILGGENKSFTQYQPYFDWVSKYEN